VATSNGNNNGYAFDKITRTGTVTVYPFSQGNTDPIGDLAVGPTGSDLWLASSQNVVRITLGGIITSFPLSPFLSYNYLDIAPGLGAKMWVGSVYPAAFTSFTPSGATPGGSRADFSPMFLGGTQHEVRGPDGATWGSMKFGLVRYGVNGLQDATPVDTANFVDAITVGPDGYLWFSEDVPTTVVGSLGAGGKVTRYPLPPRGSNTQVTGLTSGPDGALWFTEWVYNAKACIIGRITLAGQANLIALPMLPCQAGGIVTGADGNLWFVDIYNQQVDVYSP
jgi:virginiamycin B lyase